VPERPGSRRLGPSPTTVLLRLSVGLSAGAGFGVGVVLLWATAAGRAADLPFVALAQAHGQVQTIGFVGLFVFGTAAQLLPGFLTSPIVAPRRLIASGYAIAGGVLVRLIFQPLPTGISRALALSAGGIAEIAGIILALSTFLRLFRRTIQPSEPWRRVAVVSFGFLLVSTALNAVAQLGLVLGGSVVPEPLDAALVHAEILGFAVTGVLGVSLKVFPRFLLLQPTFRRLVRGGTVLYLTGTGLAVIGWLASTVVGVMFLGPTLRSVGMGLATVGITSFAAGLRIFERPSRASTAPLTTEPLRQWIQVAFGWLLVGLGIELWLTLSDMLQASPVAYTQNAAARHAIAQGFLLLVIVGLGSRILPGFAAWALVHQREMSAVAATLIVGALLRVMGELAGPAFGGPWFTVAAIGGSLGTISFLAFAARLFQTLGPPRSGPHETTGNPQSRR
jgi:hypothetical protein